MKINLKIKGYKRFFYPAMLVLAAMIWGFAFSAQKAAEKVPVFTTGMVRSLFASIFLIFAVIVFDKLNHTGRRLFSKEKIIDLNFHEAFGGFLCGAVLTAASFFQQFGINGGTDAGKASFITALYVVLVPIYSIALKKNAPLNVWISIIIAVIGFYLLCISGDLTIVASDAFVLVCSLIFPLHILFIDYFSPKCDGIRMSMVQFFTCTILNLLLSLIFESGSDTGTVIDAILPLLFLGIGSSGIAYTLQIVGQRGVNPTAASILMSLESVFGIIGAALFLGERMTEREYIGSAIVFAAVILSQLDFKSFSKKTK